MLAQWIIAVLGVLVVSIRPRSWVSTSAVATLAAVDAGLSGAGTLSAAIRAVAPMIVFLAVAIGLTAVAVRAGVASVSARWLVQRAGSGAFALFACVCGTTAVLTALVSLDGAVVLMAPVALELGRRYGAPVRPLLLGVVAVANSFSLALPEGNPTNLVVIEHLGLSLRDAAARTFVPGLAATLFSAGAIAWRERRVLGGGLCLRPVAQTTAEVSTGLVAVARIGVQILSLLAVVLPLARHGRIIGGGLPTLVGVAVAVSALAALANNLPASAIVAACLGPGPAAYAALVGLSVGALATPQGSVATLIAGDLTGVRPHVSILLPTALAAALLSTLILWLT
jgi:Na+/H+ antiporter NhaD/arsenite permease-like protein